MTTLAPYTGFAGVPFQILAPDGEMPEWHRELVRNEAKVPASNRTIYQFDGYGDWELEAVLLFASVADWQAFDATRGTRSGLRHLAVMTATAPGALMETYLGETYVRWEDVLYLGPVEPPRRRRDGRVTARVTFRRGA